MSPRSLAWKPFRDRRARRAHAPLLAAEYYLERVRERCGLPAIVLADGRDVLAGAGDGLSRLAEAGATVLGGGDATLDDADFFAHAVTIAGRSCVLASLGGRVDRVRRLEADLSRIFS